MALEWIKQRATAARNDDRSERWRIQKERTIESHSQEFFGALTELMEKSVAAFNTEFEGDARGGVMMEKRLNRFILSHPAPPATKIDCRLDYAAHAVRYRLERASTGRGGRQMFLHEDTLKFDMAAVNKVQLLTGDSIPMTLEQTTQLLLEPFF